MTRRGAMSYNRHRKGATGRRSAPNSFRRESPA
nr:MAG TPA: hypothetical protein [Caudoviricetes sp.]